MGPTSSGHPGKHPLPPSDLHSKPLPLLDLKGPWFRVHQMTKKPVFFGTTKRNRFDDPQGNFGVLYLGESEFAAFIETFGQEMGMRAVPKSLLNHRGMSELVAKRTLRILDLDGPNLARLGADARLFAADHSVAQAWSAALFAHPDAPDGIRYPARHDNQEYALALYGGGRCDKLIRQNGKTRKLGAPENAARLATLLDHYEFSMV